MTNPDTHSPHDDVLAKMDALLKRHYDRLENTEVRRPATDIPVLTDVVPVEEVIPVLTEVVEEASALDEFPFLVLEDVNPASASGVTPEHVPFALSSHSLENLDMQIQDFQDQRLSAHIAQAVDQALATMLDQFSLRLDEVVREVIDQELQMQLAEARRPQ